VRDDVSQRAIAAWQLGDDGLKSSRANSPPFAMNVFRVLGLVLLLPFTLRAEDAPVTMSTHVYKRVDGRELQVDVFQPARGTSDVARPAIAFFHGGGWVFGHRNEFHAACRRFAALGFVTAAFQYRLSVNADGTYPHPDVTLVECVKDARSAIRWLRSQAAEFAIAPDRIVVSGQSAGGQLAWSTALLDRLNETTDDLAVSARPDALVLYSSNYNTMEAWIDMIFGPRRAEIWSVSPHHNLKPGLPPALAFHGRADAMVAYYTVGMFETRMRELGNSFELVTLPNRDHYLGEGHPEYARYFDEEILEQTDGFLRRIGFMPVTR
jgi:acetyl esterase